MIKIEDHKKFAEKLANSLAKDMIEYESLKSKIIEAVLNEQIDYLKSRFNEISDLKDDWVDDGSSAVTDIAKYEMLNILNFAPSNFKNYYIWELSPTYEGGISLSCNYRNNLVSIIVEPTGEIGLLTRTNGPPSKFMEYDKDEVITLWLNALDFLNKGRRLGKVIVNITVNNVSENDIADAIIKWFKKNEPGYLYGHRVVQTIDYEV